jgi:3-hydroxyisobutyrate dehydrogenase/2-hydroxy-3-oxopropionate reductase
MTRAESAPGSRAAAADERPARPTVGLVGLGHLGTAMARRFAAEGYPLVVYNRTAERARELAEGIGARAAATPAELAAGVDVVITIVSDDDAVTALYRSPGGLLEGLTERTVAVDMSTVLPETLRALEPAIRATGAGVLDAPVSGSVALAEAGQLTIMVGGDAADLERARPALEGLGNRIFHLGPLGSGATMKLAVNNVIFGLNGAVAESLVLAERAGMPRDVAYDVIAGSAVGAPYVQYKRAAFVEPEATPPGFSVTLAEKDLRLIRILADRVGARLPQAATNLAMLEETGSRLGQEADFSAVAAALRGDDVTLGP